MIPFASRVFISILKPTCSLSWGRTCSCTSLHVTKAFRAIALLRLKPLRLTRPSLYKSSSAAPLEGERLRGGHPTANVREPSRCSGRIRRRPEAARYGLKRATEIGRAVLVDIGCHFVFREVRTFHCFMISLSRMHSSLLPRKAARHDITSRFTANSSPSSRSAFGKRDDGSVFSHPWGFNLVSLTESLQKEKSTNESMALIMEVLERTKSSRLVPFIGLSRGAKLS